MSFSIDDEERERYLELGDQLEMLRLSWEKEDLRGFESRIEFIRENYFNGRTKV